MSRVAVLILVICYVPGMHQSAHTYHTFMDALKYIPSTIQQHYVLINYHYTRYIQYHRIASRYAHRRTLQGYIIPCTALLLCLYMLILHLPPDRCKCDILLLMVHY